MATSSRVSYWMKALEVSVLAVAICFSLGATNSGTRFYELGHKLMCTCGCAQLLGECNHVGCTESTRENAELRAALAAGDSDSQILAAFSAKYGATVLAAPPTHGFDLVAWIAPFAVFGAALLGTILLIRRWAGIAGARGESAAPVDMKSLEPEERARRERIRRETGADGGL